MKRRRLAPQHSALTLPKTPTGIAGLDQVTGGGLPRGRTTLVAGGPGCGKTMLATEFLVRGALEYGEPGVFMTFEERPQDLAANVRSLGFDLPSLERRKRLAIDYVRVEKSEIEETGEYDLEALFIRLADAIDSVKASRVVLDTIESLFAGLGNPSILRAELRRLFGWLKDRKVTAIVTGERGDATVTRQGLEEYVSDCVILLDHRVHDQVTTRRLRILKYRGSVHGTNEYPFLIDERGISVMPVTALTLDHRVSSERVSTGIPQLDEMVGGQGYYRGSSVLVSGTAGTGKTTMGAHFADAACRRGEKVLYFAFEESAGQIVRNMKSVGIDLKPHLESGRLKFVVARPTFAGLELHLAIMHREVEDHDPGAVVVDPISSFDLAGTTRDVQTMLIRLVDFFKQRRITAMLTSLAGEKIGPLEATEFGVSSVVDTWILLRDIESGLERNRGIYILKSRGMAHSNQIREFVLTGKGVRLLDVSLGPAGVLTGSARIAQEAQERDAAAAQVQQAARRRAELQHRQHAVEAQIAALQAELRSAEADLAREDIEGQKRREAAAKARAEIGRARKVALANAQEHLRRHTREGRRR